MSRLECAIWCSTYVLIAGFAIVFNATCGFTACRL